MAEIQIPDSVISIGDGTFRNCASLTSIIIPDSVISIGPSVFAACSNLEISRDHPVYSLIDGVLFDKINKEVHTYLSSNTNTSYIIPDGIVRIEYGAFSFCDSLREVTIPDSVTNIGEGAFYGCDNLETIYIPSSVTTIRKEAFYTVIMLQ